MEVGRVGVYCMVFWAFHLFSMVLGTAGQGKAYYTVDTLLEVSVVREWRDETYRWILGQCWLTLDVGTLVLSAFGSGEILAIYIPKFVPIFFLLSLACLCLFNDDIKSEHAHNSHTGGGGGGSCKVTT